MGLTKSQSLWLSMNPTDSHEFIGSYKFRKAGTIMDSQEMFCKLEEHTRFESFLDDSFASKGKATSYYFGDKIHFDFPIEIPEEVMLPSHDFFWNTDKTSLAYLGNKVFDRFTLEHEGPLGLENGVVLLRAPRFLNLTDLSLDFIDIIYSLKGNVKIRINDDYVNLCAGNAVIIPPFSKTSILSIDKDNITIQIMVSVNDFKRRFQTVFSGDGVVSSFLRDAVYLNRKNFLVIRSGVDERLRRLVMEMLIEQEKHRAFSNILIGNFIELFLFYLMSDYESLAFLDNGITEIDRIAAKIINYMRENYLKLSINSLAQHFFRSESYISNILKQVTGKSYIQLLTEIKLDIAKEQLTTSSLSIDDISVLSGYNCPSQFRRVFRDIVGVKPGEFRKIIKR